MREKSVRLIGRNRYPADIWPAALLQTCVAFLLFILLFGPSFAETSANKRIALVIENDQYSHTAVLKNPVNDSDLITAKLKELNFDVQLERNLDAKGISRAVQSFAKKLNKDTDALFYYAGHGLQSIARGQTEKLKFGIRLSCHLSIPLVFCRVISNTSLLQQSRQTERC